MKFVLFRIEKSYPVYDERELKKLVDIDKIFAFRESGTSIERTITLETHTMSDNVNKPSHYQGSKGLESIEVIDNFIGDLPGKAAWCWGNAIKYLLRFQKKNGLEDLKKARKNLDWLIEELENGN